MRRLGRLLALVLVAMIVISPLLFFTGGARAAGLGLPYGFRTPDGSYVIPYYEQLLGDLDVTPGELVFGDAIDIEFINELGNRTIVVSVYEDGAPANTPSLWANVTYAVPGDSVTVLPTFEMPSTSETLPTRLCVDGGCVAFLHETPITLLPEGILTFGGLDLIAFSVTAETLLLIAPLTYYAKKLACKALWTPKITWWLVLPHVATGSLFLVATDFPALDMAFGGLEFLLFPVVIAFLWFFFVMHMFNVATPVEAEQLASGPDGRTQVSKWQLLIGVLPETGQWIVIGTRWRDWFARLRGKAPTLYDPLLAEQKDTAPATLPIVNRKIGEPDARWNPLTHDWKTFSPEPGRQTPLESFPVNNIRTRGVDATKRKELPLLKLWVDYDQWLSVKLPYIVWRQEEKTPASYNADGSIHREARIKKRWAIPHYVTPAAVAGLSSVHFEEPIAAWLRYLEQHRAYALNHLLRRMLYQLQTGVYVLADKQSDELLQEIFELLHRERFPMSIEESEEEIQHGSVKSEDDRAEGAPPEPSREGPAAEPKSSRQRRGAPS